jgi:hypothetical protein
MTIIINDMQHSIALLLCFFVMLNVIILRVIMLSVDVLFLSGAEFDNFFRNLLFWWVKSRSGLYGYDILNVCSISKLLVNW